MRTKICSCRGPRKRPARRKAFVVGRETYLEKQAVGVIGLGRMGRGVSHRLATAGFRVIAHDTDAAAARELGDAIQYAASPQELMAALPRPRIVALLVPAGEAVEALLFGEEGIADALAPGDIVIDAGNSYFRDSMRRAEQLRAQGVHFIDCGTSGGLGGQAEGYCLMVGGPAEAVSRAQLVFEAMAAPGGYLHVGAVGSGHFTKLVHNAIEYGILQAIGEGFELLQAGPFDVDVADVAKLWTKGSVIRSWLMELAAEALAADPELSAIKGEVGGGSTGRWAIEEAWNAGVPLTSIALSYSLRHRSRQSDSYAGKVIAALRHGFGGHEVVEADKDGA